MNTTTTRARALIAIAASACMATGASAQTTKTSRQKPDAVARLITRADVERIERTLAHDSMQGRQVGTPGAAKASDFIAAEMKRIGLKPAGDNGSYFQNVAGSIANSVEDAHMGIDGKGGLVFNRDYAVVPGNAAPALIDGKQVIFGGVTGDSSVTSEQIANKVVVLLPAAAGGGRGRAGGGGGGGARGGANRYAGAAAVVTVNLDGYDPRWIALISNPMKANSPRTPRPGATPAPVPQAGDRATMQPQIRMTTAGASKLFGGRDISSLKPGDTGGIMGVKFNYESTPRPTWTRNVIGIIPGSDPKLKDEWILIDAHYDHLGMKFPPVNGDSVFNGADDDASGTTAVLEIARAVKAGAAPKRSIIFAAMTGEEAGLIGTSYYLAHPYVPMNKLVANMEIEMIGRPDSLSEGSGGAWLTGYERSTLGDMLSAAGIRLFPDKRPDQHFFSRSDNIAFACAGVPAHTLSTFNLHKDYHQLTDDANTVDFDHMTEVVRSGARAALLIANGNAPQWKPGKTPVGDPTVCR